MKEKIPGGLAKGLTLQDLAKYHKIPLQSIKKKLDQGIKVEMEHTTDKSIAREIAMDHIYEDPNYYTKLKTIEKESVEEEKDTTEVKEGDKRGLDMYALELQKGLEEHLIKEVNQETTPSIQELLPELTKYMFEQGMKIKPFPKVKFIEDDEVNAKDPLGMTAFYDPANATIVLYTMGRHPKDILRSFAHEMVHHEQNLNGEVGIGKIKTTNTHEDGYLEQIERDAYEKGNIMLRKWTDSIKK